MQRYGNLSGASGVVAYALRPDAIEVKFRDASQVYVYSAARAGAQHVAQMKTLAMSGKGLCTYINQHVRDLHDGSTA